MPYIFNPLLGSGLDYYQSGGGGGAVTSVNGQIGDVVLTTDDISEGITNLYYTVARFNSAFATKTTTDLAEGTNLYFTNSRARTALSATTPISYDNSTGIFSLTTVPINLGGTGQTTANDALNAFLPSQTGQGGKVLGTDGTNSSCFLS